MYKVRVVKAFSNAEDNDKPTKIDDIIYVKDEARLRRLLGNNSEGAKYVEVLGAELLEKSKSKESIVIFQDALYDIGGIETFIYNLVKHYKNKKIRLVSRMITEEQIIRLGSMIEVEIYENQFIDCNVMLLGNYNCDYVLNNTSAKKVYQMIHADWESLCSMEPWTEFMWHPNKGVDKIISVSDAAQKGLKNRMGEDSEVIYNILDKNGPKDDCKVFITLSRATAEKGIWRIIKMVEEFKKAGKVFLWLLCSNVEDTDPEITKELRKHREIVIVPANMENKALIKGADYLVQLSDTESFCYSAYEALQRKVPVILTDFPEAVKVVSEGENGYILDMELSNLDVEKIFSKKPKKVTCPDFCDYGKWEQVFKGEL